jgi:polyisoprenoid-binding protein YceI
MMMRKNAVLALLVAGAGLVAGVMNASAAESTVDSAHSSVSFKVKSLDAYYVQGMFTKISGKFNVGEAGKEKFEFTVKSDSVNTGNEGRDKHLRSADFFNAGQFPDIKFVSKEVKAKGDGYEVTGDLTLLGVTKPITVQINKVGEGKNPKSGATVVGFETSFEIDRTEYGMKYGAAKDNKVKLTVDFNGEVK